MSILVEKKSQNSKRKMSWYEEKNWSWYGNTIIMQKKLNTQQSLIVWKILQYNEINFEKNTVVISKGKDDPYRAASSKGEWFHF